MNDESSIKSNFWAGEVFVKFITMAPFHCSRPTGWAVMTPCFYGEAPLERSISTARRILAGADLAWVRRMEHDK